MRKENTIELQPACWNWVAITYFHLQCFSSKLLPWPQIWAVGSRMSFSCPPAAHLGTCFLKIWEAPAKFCCTNQALVLPFQNGEMGNGPERIPMFACPFIWGNIVSDETELILLPCSGSFLWLCWSLCLCWDRTAWNELWGFQPILSSPKSEMRCSVRTVQGFSWQLLPTDSVFRQGLKHRLFCLAAWAVQ